MEVLEHHEKIEHAAGHGGHAGGHAAAPWAKRVGLLIAVLAAALAVAETGGKSAQTAALNANVEASNLWAFYQAKAIRASNTRVAAEAAKLGLAGELPPAQRSAGEAQIRAWEANAARYESDPKTNEGRAELSLRAKRAEGVRDERLAAYHWFELASAAFQIAIVLASAAVITGLALLAWGAGGLGLVGAGLAALGYLAPTLIH